MVTGWQVRVTTLAASPDGNWDQGTQIGCGYNGGENLYIFPDVGHCRPMCMCVLQVCVGIQSYVWPQFVVSADSMHNLVSHDKHQKGAADNIYTLYGSTEHIIHVTGKAMGRSKS